MERRLRSVEQLDAAETATILKLTRLAEARAAEEIENEEAPGAQTASEDDSAGLAV